METSLRRADATAEARGRSRSQLYLDIKEGRMTPPLTRRPGRQASVWPAYEIDAINRAEIRGASDDEIRELVKRLVEARSKGAGRRPETLDAAERGSK